jgi:glutamyl-tRNA reductase
VDRVIDQADIVIGSISIDRPILTRGALKARKGDRPLFLIDLGIPRNFAADLADLDSVYLYNIDDLAGIADENKALREAAAHEAELIIEYGLVQFERWRHKRASQPEILDLRETVQAICSAEVAKYLPNLLDAREDVAQELTRAISQKLSHELTRLVERHSHGADPLEGGRFPFVIVPKKDFE